MYDFIIVGGGISGSILAYMLRNRDQKIAIIDSSSGNKASLTAGAFISPILGHPNRYKKFTTKSIIYSTNFYKQNFAKYIDNCGTIRICKDKEELEFMKKLEPNFDFSYSIYDNLKLKNIGINSKYCGYLFDIGSLVEPSTLLQKLQLNIEIIQTQANNIEIQDEILSINNLKTKHIILANGADNSIIKEPYINIRKIYGHKLNIETTTKQNFNIHQTISISKNIDNKIQIGATHHRDIDDPSKFRDTDKQKLLLDAKKMIDIKDINKVDISGAFRACSVDYFPIAGELIDSRQTMSKFKSIADGTKIAGNLFIRHKNIFMLNGLGGRGFSSAPYVADLLIRHILDKQKLENSISLDRLFIKWARKDYKKG
jgi:glycine/D-amino acid oxidase-like deaminating enzyme